MWRAVEKRQWNRLAEELYRIIFKTRHSLGAVIAVVVEEEEERGGGGGSWKMEVIVGK